LTSVVSPKVKLALKPSNSLSSTRLTTPATASEPQAAEAPPVTTSTRFTNVCGQGREIDAAAQKVRRHHALAVEQHQGAA
jgi:hypothetical protein